ncbi:MAG: hypothetical protein AAFY20_12855 [Cyanobacteria bacterium J06639_14]
MPPFVASKLLARDFTHPVNSVVCVAVDRQQVESIEPNAALSDRNGNFVVLSLSLGAFQLQVIVFSGKGGTVSFLGGKFWRYSLSE